MRQSPLSWQPGTHLRATASQICRNGHWSSCVQHTSPSLGLHSCTDRHSLVVTSQNKPPPTDAAPSPPPSPSLLLIVTLQSSFVVQPACDWQRPAPLQNSFGPHARSLTQMQM